MNADKSTRLCAHLGKRPGACVSDWAGTIGASPRTIAGLCLRAFGMPFGKIRQQLRLQAALPRLLAGEPIAAVALDVGYATASACLTAFSRCLGISPSGYLQRAMQQR